MTLIDQLTSSIINSFSEKTFMRMFDDLKVLEFDDLESIVSERTSDWPYASAKEAVHQVIYNRIYTGLSKFLGEEFEETCTIDINPLFPELISHLISKQIEEE